MTDHTEKNEDEHIILADEPLLKDSKAPSKLPWILAAVTIVLIVMSLQFGSRLLMHKLTQKKEAATQVLIEEKETLKALAMPLVRKQKPAQAPTNPQIDVVKYLHEKQVNAPDELARARLLARIEERKKAREEEESMMQSPVLLDIGVGNQQAMSGAAKTDANMEARYAQNPNVAYLKSVSNQSIEEVNAGMFGDLRFRIRKGKILRGVTESAIDSDLPGMIRGHITADIYGDQGESILIPNGSGLIGEYRSGDIKNGQTSLYVVWTRLQLSNGIYVTLDSPGSDPLGRAGMTGPVDHHYLQRYGASLLTSIVSAGAATWGVNGNDRYNSVATYRQGMSASFAQTANQELQQNALLQNTIRPPQGTEISIMVNKDISFEDVLSGGMEP